MTKIKIFAAICIILGFWACNDTDAFWQTYYEDQLANPYQNCDNAVAGYLNAKDRYENSPEDSLEEYCTIYKYNIQNVINQCGDSTGVYQNLLDDLGDCGANSTECEVATNARLTAEGIFNATDPGSDNYTQVCNTYALALQNEIDICGDDDGVLQGKLDALDCG